jgi:hypothetical protein
MEWAALITWVITALFGFVMLAIWLQRGGMQQSDGGRINPPLILSHFLLAAGGLVLWIVYVIVDKDVLTWIAFAVLVVVALIGWTMFFRWLRQRRGAPAAVGTASVAPAGGGAEQGFPVSVVTLHGIAAVTTVVLVFLTAIGVGG